MEEIDHVPLNHEQTTMRYLTPLALLLLLLCSLPGAAQQTRLHGTISSATGEPLVKAHVRLVPYSSPMQPEMISAPEFRVAEVAEDGSWSMVGVEPGLYDLLVTAVDHDYMRTLLPVDGSDPEIGLDVRLPLPVYVETIAMGIVGPFNKFGRVGFETLEKDTLGRYVADFASDRDTVRLQVRGIAELPNRLPVRHRRMSPALARRDLPGPELSPIVGFEYDGEGDYLAVIPVVDGRVRVMVDLPHLREIVESTAGDSGAVMPRDAWLAELYQLSDSLDREDQAVARATTYGERHPTMEETEREYALVEEVERRRRSEMIEMMRSEETPLPLRRYAAVQLAIIEKEWTRGYRPWHNPDRTLREEITALVPVTSPWWDLAPYAAYDLYVSQEIGSDAWRERITKIREETDAWGFGGILLAMLTLDAKGADVQIATPIREMNTRNRTQFLVSTGIVRDPDTERFERLHADLLEEYAHYWMVDHVVRMEK